MRTRKGGSMAIGFRDDSADNSARFSNVFLVPQAAIDAFVGRDGLLDELFDDLKSADLTRHAQALYGMGGLGKTQIAAEFAHRYRENYRVVYWIRAEEPASIGFDFAALGRALGLSFAPDATLEGMRQETLEHLAGRDD